MSNHLSDAELTAYLRATRPVADLTDDELMDELCRSLGPLPDPATIAQLRRLREQAMQVYRQAYGRPATDIAAPDPGREQTTRAAVPLGEGETRPGSPHSGRGGSPVPPLPGRTPVGGDVSTKPLPPPAHHAVAAGREGALIVPLDGRQAGGAEPTSPAPPAAYDEYRPISDWWESEPEPRMSWRPILVGLPLALALWVLAIVVCVWAAGGLR